METGATPSPKKSQLSPNPNFHRLPPPSLSLLATFLLTLLAPLLSNSHQLSGELFFTTLFLIGKDSSNDYLTRACLVEWKPILSFEISLLR